MKNPAGRQHHICLREGDIGRYVLLPGDPGRCEKIARHLENPQFITSNREYVTYTGTLCGEKVAVTSTGIGCPSAAIAMEELIAIGADTFIRIGTSGGMQPFIKTGDLAVVTGAIRDEGTTLQYMPIEFPAIAHLDVVMALAEGAQRTGFPYHLGISQSKDSFYGEVEPGRMPVSVALENRWKAWKMGGAICSEMEAASIFILSSIHCKRAGGIMLMAGDFDASDPTSAESGMEKFDVERAILAAIEGLKVLINQDGTRA